jgi:HD-like signal output (HDOD) protein
MGAPFLIADNDALSSPSLTSDDHAIRTRLSRVMMGADFPALSRLVVDTLGTLDHDGSSLQRLAEVVLREYGLTMSVLRTANSAHYRRGGRPTESATHAMMVLGAQVVRNLAGSMVLFEHFQRRSPELKTLMISSLLTASHARATALHLGEDPEAAHLCGMYRNLGEVLTACYFREDYRRIQSLMVEDGRSEASAMRMALGFSYADFGAAVAAHWDLPDMLAEAIRPTPGREPTRLAAISGFSESLTQTLYRPAPGTSAGDGLGPLLEAHTGAFKLTRTQVGRIVSDALAETQAVLRTTEDADTNAQLQALTGAARQVFGPALTVPESDAPIILQAPDLSTRGRLMQELERSAAASSGAAIGTVLLQALEVLTRGGPFDRALVCFLSSDRLQLDARTGIGVGIEALIPRFSFPMSSRGGPVAALTQQRHALYLPTDRPLSFSEARWAQEFGVTQFGVFPLVVLGKVIGCLYVDRLGDKPAPDRATVRYAQTIAELVVDAIVNRRR